MENKLYLWRKASILEDCSRPPLGKLAWSDSWEYSGNGVRHRIPFSGTEGILEFDGRLRGGRNRSRARDFRRCWARQTLLGRGAAFDWRQAPSIVECFRRKERPGSVFRIITTDRRSISFSIHRPTPRFAFVARPFESRIEHAIKESARFPSPLCPDDRQPSPTIVNHRSIRCSIDYVIADIRTSRPIFL